MLTKVRIIDFLAQGSFGKIYLVSVLDAENKHVEFRCIKQEINWEHRGLQYDVVRQVGLHETIRNQNNILTADKLLMHKKYMFVFMEYLPNTYHDMLKVLRELCKPVDPSKTDPLAEDYERAWNQQGPSSDAEEEDEEEEKEEEEEGDEPETHEDDLVITPEDADVEMVDDDEPGAEEEVVDVEEDEETKEVDKSHESVNSEGVIQDRLEFPNGSIVIFEHDAFVGDRCITECSQFTVEEHPEDAKDDEDLDALHAKETQQLKDSLVKTYRLHNKNGFNAASFPKFFRHIATELLQILQKLQQYGYLHDDIKPHNVLIRLEERLIPAPVSARSLKPREPTKEYHIQLVLADYDHVRRLNHLYDIDQVPYYPIAGPEFFFRQPIVSQALDTWAVGLMLGDLMYPQKGFFPDPTDEDNNSQEENEAEKLDDDEEAEEDEEEEGWSGLTTKDVSWFSDMLEARGLMQWLDKKGRNFDDVDPIGKKKEELDEEEEDEKGDDEGEDVEIELEDDDGEDNIVTIGNGITAEEYDALRAQFEYISLHPNNLDNFVDHIVTRRFGYGIEMPYWVLRWWIQMFIADPSLRPTPDVLLKQLAAPETAKMKALVGTKKKPLVVPTPTTVTPYNPRLYRLQNPLNWTATGWGKYGQNSAAVANEYQLANNSIHFNALQQEAIFNGMKEVRVEFEYQMYIYSELTLMVLQVFYNLVNTPADQFVKPELLKVDESNSEAALQQYQNMFISCFLLVERVIKTSNIFYEKDGETEDEAVNDDSKDVIFKPLMTAILIQLRGAIDVDSGIHQALQIVLYHVLEADCKNVDYVIAKPEIQELTNEFEVPVTFFELWHQISAFYLVQFVMCPDHCKGNVLLADLVRAAYYATTLYVDASAKAAKGNKKFRFIADQIKENQERGQVLVCSSHGDEEDLKEEVERNNVWLHLLYKVAE
jgi:serine/threonine protein kinase